MHRTVLRVLVATLMILPITAAGQSASAAPVDLVCPFAANFTLTPGVTLTSKSVLVGGTVAVGTSLLTAAPCSSVLTGVPYTGATATVSGSGTLACVTIGTA